MVGWVAPSMAVADGTTDCDSVVVCAARWSRIASGDGMVYSSGLYHDDLPVVVEWVALWWFLPTAQQLQNTLIRLFMAVCFLCVFSFLLCCVLNMP